MLNKRKTILFGITLITTILLLTGCGSDKTTPTKQGETIEATLLDLTIKKNVNFVEANRDFTIVTENQSLFWNDSLYDHVTKIYPSDDETDRVTYTITKDGKVQDPIIYLSPESIQKQSAAYIKEFKSNFPIERKTE